MFSKSLFSKFTVVAFYLLAAISSVSAQSGFCLDIKNDTLKFCFDYVHAYYDYLPTDYHYLFLNSSDKKHGLSRIKKIITGLTVANLTTADMECLNTSENFSMVKLFEQMIKSDNPIKRESAIHILCYLMLYCGLKDGQIDDCDDPFLKGNRKFFLDDKDYLLDLCLEAACDNDANVRKACYDFFVEYFIKTEEKIPYKFSEKFRDALNDQVELVRCYALILKLISIKKDVQCSQIDFDIFKKAVCEKNEFVRSYAVYCLKIIAQLGFFAQDIFDIATEMFDSEDEYNVDKAALLLGGIACKSSGLTLMVIATAELLQSSDSNKQVYGCLICEEIFMNSGVTWNITSENSLILQNPEGFDAKKILAPNIPILKSKINNKIIMPILNGAFIEEIWDKYGSHLNPFFFKFLGGDFEFIKQNLSNVDKSSSMLNEAKHINNLFFWANPDLQKAAYVANECVKSDDIELQSAGLCIFNQLVKNDILNEDELFAIKKCVKNVHLIEIYKPLIELCNNLSEKKYGISDIIEVVNKIDSFFLILDDEFLMLSFELTSYTEFCETGLRFLWIYANFGGGFTYGDLFEMFMTSLIGTCVKSNYHVSELREFAEELIKSHKKFGDIRLGIAIYEELIENKTCLSECVTFIEDTKKNYDDSVHGFLATLYEKLVENDFAIDEAIEYVRFLINRNDKKFPPQVTSLLDRLASKGYSIQEAFE